MVPRLPPFLLRAESRLSLHSAETEVHAPEAKVSTKNVDKLFSSLQEIAYNISLITREPNPSIVLLITSLSLATYIFFPPIFFDLASKAIMLAYIRVTGNMVNDT